ncbi:nucleolar pre ribosomal associated protein [Trichuris trichiura]|uniref:Nucleolar pre ribosomal associated protein n=1 Tax=Trichuris trichiura TaxID=36087 RepID=A0A077Z3V7_TRITR|nr:nucleolar pre ribosomal associated protein [Trichuris trichiura]
MKRPLQLDDNVSLEESLKKKKAVLLSKKFNGSLFHSSIGREDADITSCMTVWLNAYDAYEAGKSEDNPVAEFFVHSYDGEELVKWLERVEESFTVHSILSVIFKIFDCASKPGSSFRQRAIRVFGQFIRRAAALRRQLRQPTVAYRNMVLKVMTSGASLGAVAVDDLIRFFDLDDAALTEQFKDSTLRDGCINFVIVVIRFASRQALHKICGEKFILQKMLRNVKSSSLQLICSAVDTVRQIIETAEVPKFNKVRIFHGCSRSICSLIEESGLEECLKNFFYSCIEQLRVPEVNLDHAEKPPNNILYKLHVDLIPHAGSSPLARAVIVKLAQLCPDLMNRCLEYDCGNSTDETRQQIGLLWATLLKDTSCNVDSFSSNLVNVEVFAKFVVPDLAVKSLAMPLWKSRNVDSTIIGSKLLRALVLRADRALNALQDDDLFRQVGSIFFEVLPAFEEVRLCFMSARKLYANGGPYELAVSTAKLLVSNLLLFHRLSKDFLLNVDLVQIFLATEDFLSMGLKLQLISLIPQSSVELVDLVRKLKGGKSFLGQLLRCYEKDTNAELFSLDSAFCQMVQLSGVLANHTTEMKLWLATFAYAGSDPVRECFEKVVHAAICSQYSRYEDLLRSAETLEGNWPTDGVHTQVFFDQFVLAIQQRLEFSILVPTLLWWCQLQKPLAAEVEQCALRCLRLILWFQKGNRDRLLTVLRNSDYSLAKIIANEETRLDKKGKLRADADAFEVEAFSRYISKKQALQDCAGIFDLQSCPARRLDNFLFLVHLWRKARAKNLTTEDHMFSLIDQAMSVWDIDAELFLQIDMVKDDLLSSLLRLHFSVKQCLSSPSFRQLVLRDLPQYMNDLIVAPACQSKSMEFALQLASMATAEQLMVTLSNVDNSQNLNWTALEFFWLQLLEFAKNDHEIAARLSRDKCTRVITHIFWELSDEPSYCDSVFKIMNSLCSCVPIKLNLTDCTRLLFRYIVKSGHAASLFITLQKADRKGIMKRLLIEWAVENSDSLPLAADILLPIFRLNIDCDNVDFLSTIYRLYADRFADVAHWNSDLISLAFAVNKIQPGISPILFSSCRKVVDSPNLIQSDHCLTIFAAALDDCLSAMELLVLCIEKRGETKTTFECTLVDRVKILWRPPIGSSLYRKLWQLILSRRFSSPSHVQLVSQMVASLKSTMGLPLVSMVFGHSQFGPVVVIGKEEQLRHSLLSLLLVCCENDHSLMDLSNVPALLSSYWATLGLVDATILKLLALYESIGIGLSIFYPLVWGSTALSSFANWKLLGPSLWNRPSADDVLSSIDEEKMKKTILNFPLNLQLDVRHSYAASDLYDPRFLLPALGRILRSDSVVNCRRFVTTHCLSFLLCGLSFADPDLRVVCYSNLVDFHEALKGSENFAEKSQLLFLLALVRQSVARDNQRIPFIISLFLSRLLWVFINPKSPVYRTACQFLLIGPRFNLGLVPNFLRFFHSSSAHYRQERSWILNLLADGLRTTIDFDIAYRLFTFKFLFSFYHCSLCEPSQRSAILRFMLAASKIPKAVNVLCKQHNWLGFLLTLCQDQSVWIVVEVLCSIFRFIFRRNRSLCWNLAVGWISCACTALSEAKIRSENDAELAVRLTSMLLKAYCMHPFGSTVAQLSGITDKFSLYMDATKACETRRMLGKAFIQLFCVAGAQAVSNDLLRHYLSTVYHTSLSDQLLVNTVRKIRKLCQSHSKFDELKPYLRTAKYALKMHRK